MSYASLVESVELPRVALIRQRFEARCLDCPGRVLHDRLLAHPAGARIRPGMRIAVTAGSRGMASLPELLQALVEAIRTRGGEPFIVPAMGSHGGGTAEGQLDILRNLGITEESMGCPICSSMDTVEVGRLSDGTSVRMDRVAMEQADGIVLFNRIKPHNAFRGPLESGLAKMLAVGLGKQSGADACHARGFAHMAERVASMAEIKLARCPILFGVGTLENAHDRVQDMVICLPGELLAREREALKVAKASMTRLPLGDPSVFPPGGDLDVLVVDCMGKEFSGGGMDSNITGRFSQAFMTGGPYIRGMAVLDLSEASHGNAIGLGLADVTTERLLAKYDREAVYTNCLTAHVPTGAKLPIIMPDDRTAIQAAITFASPDEPNALRLLRIPNTLHLSLLYASEAMLPELTRRAGVDILSSPRPMEFDAAGHLLPFPEDESN